MKKQSKTQDQSIVNIKNSGRHAERIAAVAVGYTAAVTKGTAIGTKKGFMIGWNYDK